MSPELPHFVLRTLRNCLGSSPSRRTLAPGQIAYTSSTPQVRLNAKKCDFGEALTVRRVGTTGKPKGVEVVHGNVTNRKSAVTSSNTTSTEMHPQSYVSHPGILRCALAGGSLSSSMSHLTWQLGSVCSAIKSDHNH